MKYYSPSTKGFYSKDVHAPSKIPQDVIGLSEIEYQNILEKLQTGKVLHVNEGALYVVDPIVSASDTLKYEIAVLEAQQTPRRLREAALSEEGYAWLENLNSQITALRSQIEQGD